MRLTPSTAVVLKFVWHVIVAVAGFLAIFSAAIILNMFTKFVRQDDLLPVAITYCMDALEYCLIGIDVAGFAYFIWVEFVNLLVSIRALRIAAIAAGGD